MCVHSSASHSQGGWVVPLTPGKLQGGSIVQLPAKAKQPSTICSYEPPFARDNLVFGGGHSFGFRRAQRPSASVHHHYHSSVCPGEGLTASAGGLIFFPHLIYSPCTPSSPSTQATLCTPCFILEILILRVKRRKDGYGWKVLESARIREVRMGAFSPQVRVSLVYCVHHHNQPGAGTLLLSFLLFPLAEASVNTGITGFLGLFAIVCSWCLKVYYI